MMMTRPSARRTSPRAVRWARRGIGEPSKVLIGCMSLSARGGQKDPRGETRRLSAHKMTLEGESCALRVKRATPRIYWGNLLAGVGGSGSRDQPGSELAEALEDDKGGEAGLEKKKDRRRR
jgi:hypothetical protein